MDRILGDNMNQNKQYIYYTEFEVTLSTMQELEDLKEELYQFPMRIMNIPDLNQKYFDVYIRIDFEEIFEINLLADVLYDLDYIGDEDYENFESNIEEY